jgi:uncharacterized membrane-anchored protein
MTYNGFDIERVRKEAQTGAKMLLWVMIIAGMMLVMSGIPVLSPIALVFLIFAVPIGIWYVSKKGTEAVEELIRRGKR